MRGKTFSATAAIVAVLGMGACKKVEQPSAPQPTPVLTPHPATGATERAIHLYPELAVKNSAFNRTFLDLYEELRQNNPEMLTRVDWPLDLAARAGMILGIRPTSETTPSPQVVIVTPAPQTPRTLDRGAYNEKRNVVHGTPSIIYVPVH
jgi:hypothetical protein